MERRPWSTKSYMNVMPWATGNKPADLILDSNDLERERGITILSKNVSVRYKE